MSSIPSLTRRRFLVALAAPLALPALGATDPAAQRRHDRNPVERPVHTVKPSDYQYPRGGDRVLLRNLKLVRWDGTSSGRIESLDTVVGTAVGVLVHEDSTPQRPIAAPWVPTNGATLYKAIVFDVDLPGGAIFNNNTDRLVDPRAWSWMRIPGRLKRITVCYTSRGMVATPDMPTRLMKPQSLTN